MNTRILSSLFIYLSALSQLAIAKQKVLLYSRTAGYKHASIPNAIKAIEKLGKQHGFSTVSSKDPKLFEKSDNLNQFDALVFISVSGEALSSNGEVNMMKYIENGGGYFGIHEACDALYHSPWYGRLLGAYFDYHPYLQSFKLDVQSHNHPSTSFLNKTWTVTDEVYTFNSNPKKLGKTVVLTADPSSYKDPGGDSTKELASVEGKEHPIAWYKESNLLNQPKIKVGGGVDDSEKTPKNQLGTGGDGRAYYTALGHTKACWTDETFLQHIHGALSWVLESPSIRSNNDSLPSTAPGSDFVANSTTKSSSSSSSNNVTTSSPSTSSSPGGASTTVAGSANSQIHAASCAKITFPLPVLLSLVLIIFSSLMLL